MFLFFIIILSDLLFYFRDLITPFGRINYYQIWQPLICRQSMNKSSNPLWTNKLLPNFATPYVQAINEQIERPLLDELIITQFGKPLCADNQLTNQAPLLDELIIIKFGNRLCADNQRTNRVTPSGQINYYQIWQPLMCRQSMNKTSNLLNKLIINGFGNSFWPKKQILETVKINMLVTRFLFLDTKKL